MTPEEEGKENHTATVEMSNSGDSVVRKYCLGAEWWTSLSLSLKALYVTWDPCGSGQIITKSLLKEEPFKLAS